MKKLVGYFIKRTWKNCPPGKTLCMQSQQIYPTEGDAKDALERRREKKLLDDRFDYDVVDVWMEVDEA